MPTLQNVAKELDNIIETGYYTFNVPRHLHDSWNPQAATVKEASLQDQLHAAKAEAEAAKQTKQLVDEELLACKSEILSLRNELKTRSSGVWKVSADKVEIGTEIGVGGWGTVLNGTIKVAIKRLHPAILNPRNISRIKREMELLAEVQHPNLVQFIGTVYDEEVERDQKPPLILIELLDMNLRQAYEQNKLQPNNHLSIFTDVTRALNYLHQRYEPIIHRDVSAPNVLLQRLPGNMWRGKVSDLGSANFLKQASTMGDGAILYSPPEVIPRAFDHSQKHLQQTVKIDVYSYGVLLCEVNTSRLPDAGSYREMIEQVQRKQPQMHALIVHCTQEDPKDRPTMADVLVALPKIYQKKNIDGSDYGQRLSLTDSRHQEPSTRGQLTLSIPAPQQPVIAQRPSQYPQDHRQSTPTGGSDQPTYSPAPQRPVVNQLPPQYQQDPRPSQYQQDPRPSQYQQDPRPSQYQQDPRPSQYQQDPRPSQYQQDPRPSQDQQDPRPSQDQQDPRPSQYQQDPRPSQDQQDPRPSQDQQDPRPSQYQQDPKPSQYQQDPKPSQYQQDPRQYTQTGGSDQPTYSPAPQRPVISHTGNAPVPTHFNLGVGSTVQLVAVEPNAPPRYGVIRWTGNVEGIEGMIAGIELEEYMDGCNDGTFPQREEKHFDCPSGHGLYFPLAKLRPDERFAGGAHISARRASYNNPIQAPIEEEIDQYIDNASDQLCKYVGEGRGIQGHQNSCYLDSTVFGLFALSDIFDNMFLDAKNTNDENKIAISELLWKGIVNPLRKNGIVRFESVMMLRTKLEELGKMEGITEKEKDPVEFLNMLFKHMLRVTPFISIRRPFGVEEEFFVQLFVEFDSSLKVPTIEKLLNKMFIEQNISFTKCPFRLLIQVPRFGREFKTYQKIVPDLKLDIKELTDAAGPKCVRCGKRSSVKCYDCKDSFRNDGNGVHFCTSCSKIVHGKETRARHQLQDIDNVLSDLDLLSVICIETSHYVCFTRDYDKNKWIFFDSMANRLYDTYNIPKVTDCTDLLNDWVYPHTGNRTRLMDTPPRQLPELVRRFTQDVYMCVYIQPEVAMYGES